MGGLVGSQLSSCPSRDWRTKYTTVGEGQENCSLKAGVRCWARAIFQMHTCLVRSGIV